MKTQFAAHALIALVALATTACVSTDIKSHTDAAYRGVAIEAVAVGVSGGDAFLKAETEEALVEDLSARGVKAFSMLELVPQTQVFSPQELVQFAVDAGAKMFLHVSIHGDQSRSDVTGYSSRGHTTGHVSGTYGYGSFNAIGHANSYSTTSANYGHARGISATAVIYDIQTEDIVWKSNIRTKGSGPNRTGQIFTSDSMMSSSIASNIVSELKENNHLK